VGAFHEEHVHVGGRLAQQLLEQRGLAAVRAQVAGVEEALPVGLDEQRVRVEPEWSTR
jgi:hypothetical protein